MAFDLENTLETVRAEKAAEKKRLTEAEDARRAKKKEFAVNCAEFLRSSRKLMTISVSDTSVQLDAADHSWRQVYFASAKDFRLTGANKPSNQIPAPAKESCGNFTDDDSLARAIAEWYEAIP